MDAPDPCGTRTKDQVPSMPHTNAAQHLTAPTSTINTPHDPKCNSRSLCFVKLLCFSPFCSMNCVCHTCQSQVREVLDTARTVAQLGRGSFGAYVISMARAASDVLAVELLQREAAYQVLDRSVIRYSILNYMTTLCLHKSACFSGFCFLGGGSRVRYLMTRYHGTCLHHIL